MNFCQSKTQEDARRCYTLCVKNDPPPGFLAAWRKHDRRWKNNRYVYAVVSRRSSGISIGINLSPGKECNFDCVYCQVDRSAPPATRKVDLEKLAEELSLVLEAEKDGSLYIDEPFNVLAPAERGVRDIAFSGDGEPTTFSRLEEAILIAAQARRRFSLDPVKLVLITNAACLDKPAVRAALKVLDENNGEIWAKLDAGSEEYFRRVNRSNVDLERILGNILEAARMRPLTIQSLWFRMGGNGPLREEVDAYCGRLKALLMAGAMLKSLQIYTIARNPSESFVSALSSDELDQLASIVKSCVLVPVEVFYSA
jgi:wyosine [tRNA(Phe)-imidazoG37] synthetase (radical SAM superfamily)